jgi:hypothetical protein
MGDSARCLMIREYVRVAMEKARCEIIDDPETYC